MRVFDCKTGSALPLIVRVIYRGCKMTRREIVKEKEIISFMILEKIQDNHNINQLASLLARQAWLSSEIEKESEGRTHYHFGN
jgi:hypothetical protein